MAGRRTLEHRSNRRRRAAGGRWTIGTIVAWRRLALPLTLAVTAWALPGCEAQPRSVGFDAAADVAEEKLAALGHQGEAAQERGAAAAAAPGGQPPAPVPRKLVRTVQLVLTVGDTEAVATRIEGLVSEAGGYVSGVDAHRRPDDLLAVRMTLRVPVERLDDVVAALRGLATQVERQSLSTEDVTDRWVDLEARLSALRATEEELTELLDESRDRGHSAEDIMAIYRELTGIRSQIEQLQGQLRQLDDRTTYSTIQLELRPTEAARPLVDQGWQPSVTVRQSTRALLGALQWLADAAIVLAIAVLPVLAVLGLGLWLVLRLVGRWRMRRGGPAPPPEA